MFNEYLTSLRAIKAASPTEKARNRDYFISGIKDKLAPGGKIYVLISPAYDLKENSRDIGNVLHAEFPNVRTSRSPYRHPKSLELDMVDLCNKAKDSSLIVYLAHHICDQYTYNLPTGGSRHGHHVEEAIGVAENLAKPLIIGHLDNCLHSPCEDMNRLTNSGLDLKLFYIGGSLKN